MQLRALVALFVLCAYGVYGCDNHAFGVRRPSMSLVGQVMLVATVTFVPLAVTGQATPWRLLALVLFAYVVGHCCCIGVGI